MTAGFGVGFVVCGRGSCGAMRELGAILTRCLQHHSCAVLSGGSLRCWGWNHAGQVMLVAAFLLEGCLVCLEKLLSC